MTDTLERVKTYQQLIGGSFVDAASGETAELPFEIVFEGKPTARDQRGLGDSA